MDAKIAGNIAFSPAEWKDVDMSSEDLAKSFFSPPFKEPSPALFSIMTSIASWLKFIVTSREF